MFFLRISREAPRHDVSRGGQIIPSSLEVAESYHLYLIKNTQPLTSLEELRIIPSLRLSRDQNQTIPTSLEYQNHTILTSLEGRNHTISTYLEGQNHTISTSLEGKNHTISAPLEGQNHTNFTSLKELHHTMSTSLKECNHRTVLFDYLLEYEQCDQKNSYLMSYVLCRGTVCHFNYNPHVVGRFSRNRNNEKKSGLDDREK